MWVSGTYVAVEGEFYWEEDSKFFWVFVRGFERGGAKVEGFIGGRDETKVISVDTPVVVFSDGAVVELGSWRFNIWESFGWWVLDGGQGVNEFIGRVEWVL